MLRNKTCKHHPNNLSRFLTRFFLSFGFYWVRWLHCGCILNVLQELYIQKTSSKKVRIFQISNNSSTNSSKIRLWFEDWHVHKDKYLASPFHFHAAVAFFCFEAIRCGARRSLSVDMSWWFTALDLDRATSVFERSDGETTKMLHQNEWLEPENYRHLIQPPHKFPDSKSSKRDMYVNPLVISHRITFKKTGRDQFRIL